MGLTYHAGPFILSTFCAVWTQLDAVAEQGVVLQLEAGT